MSTEEVFKKTRKEYELDRLEEGTVDPDPLAQFKAWFSQASEREQGEVNACALATAGRDGRPSVRMVLLKAVTQEGLVFFTNYESKKGRQLAENPHASLLFYWPTLERQVRFEGVCEKIASSESDSYFFSRPRSAQCGAMVSLQSRVASSRDEIDAAYSALVSRVGEGPLERPPGWGGYRLRPEVVEFWQGRESRLHDRIQYSLVSGIWRTERLWP
jgi:pyridoxamine 5'-phosphate oxidase